MGAHGSGKGGPKRFNYRNGGKGASRKGRDQHRKSKQFVRRQPNRGKDNAACQEADIDEVCELLADLPDLGTDKRRFRLTSLYTKHFRDEKTIQALADNFPPDSEAGDQFQLALEQGLPWFDKVRKERAIRVLSDCGFELNLQEDARNRGRGSGTHSGRTYNKQELRRETSNRDDRVEVRPAQKKGLGKKLKKMQKQRQGGDFEDRRGRENYNRNWKGGGAHQKKVGKRKAKGDEEYNLPDKRGRTGANTIDVDWKPTPKESEEEKVDGVTPKSKPPSPPRSPVRGPAGRGQQATLPGWMKNSSGSAPALTDRSASPPPQPAGRGRGSVDPSWKTGGSDRRQPSMPALTDGEKDASAAAAERTEPAEDPLESFYKDRREEGQREDSSDWHQNQKWKGRGSSRSRTRAHAGSKQAEQKRRPATSSGGRSSWGSKDQGERKQRPWDRGAREPRPEYQESRDEPHTKWEKSVRPCEPAPELVLRCCKHGKKRNWAVLMKVDDGTDGNWVCRPESPCVIFYKWEGHKSDGCDKDEDSSVVAGEDDKEASQANGCERSSAEQLALAAEPESERPKKVRLRPGPDADVRLREAEAPAKDAYLEDAPVEEARSEHGERSSRRHRTTGERMEKKQKKHKDRRYDAPPPPGWNMYPSHPGMRGPEGLPPPPPLPTHRASHGPPMHPNDMGAFRPPMAMMPPGYPHHHPPHMYPHTGPMPYPRYPYQMPPPGAMAIRRSETTPRHDNRRSSHSTSTRQPGGHSRHPGNSRHPPGSHSRGSSRYQARDPVEMRIDDTDL